MSDSDDLFMDYVAYKIFIGEGHEVGFGEPPEESTDFDLSEEIDKILEPLRNLRWDDE